MIAMNNDAEILKRHFSTQNDKFSNLIKADLIPHKGETGFILKENEFVEHFRPDGSLKFHVLDYLNNYSGCKCLKLSTNDARSSKVIHLGAPFVTVIFKTFFLNRI